MVGTNIAPRNAYEMDYNTGATAGIAEMLLQSHQGFIHLLPALPAAWPSGQVTGLCARGGFVVDLTWANSSLASATVRSRLGGVCRLRADALLTVTHDGQPVSIERVDAHTIAFKTQSDASYVLASV